MKTLYFYTDLVEARRTIRSGVIYPRPNQPLSFWSDEAPYSIWLTTNSQLSQGLIRFAIRLPNDRAVPWLSWVAKHGYGPKDRLESLVAVTGGKVAARARRVSEHQITDHRWISVIDLFTGEKLWEPKGRRDTRGGV